jgi:hypothetical protein
MPDLCTLAEVKARGSITGTDRDALIATLISEATRRLCRATGREFMPQATATRRFDVNPLACDPRRLYYPVPLPQCDLRTATTVTLHPESVSEAQVLAAGTDYELDTDRDTASAGLIRLSGRLSMGSTRAANFGLVGLEIVGAWGIWADASAVAAEVKAAAEIYVLAGIDKAVADGLGVADLASGAGMAQFSRSWDIPWEAWLKVRDYSRELGVS